MKSTGATLKTDCPLGQQEPLEVILEMLGDEDEAQEEEEEEEDDLEDEDEYGVDVGEMVLVDDQGEAMDVLQELGVEHGQETEEDYEVEMHETYSEAKENEEEIEAVVENDEYYPGGSRDERSATSPQEISEAEVAEEATVEAVMRYEGPSLLTRRDMTSVTNRRASLTQYRFRSFDEGGEEEKYNVTSQNEERERRLVHSFSSEGAHQSISSSSDSNQTVIEFDTRGGSLTSVSDRKLSDLGRSGTDDSVANLELDSVTKSEDVNLPVEPETTLDGSQKMEDIDLTSESNNELEESDYLSAVENSIEALDAMEWESTTSTRVVKRYLPLQKRAFMGDKSLSSSSEKDEGEVERLVKESFGVDDKDNGSERDRKGNTYKERTPEEERQYSVLDPDYIERENRKIQKFIDNLYGSDKTSEKSSQEGGNTSESAHSADSCQDALDLLSRSSKSSNLSNSSLFRPVASTLDEARKRSGEADYKRMSSTEIAKMSTFTEDSKRRKVDEDLSKKLFINENTVTKLETKVKREVTQDELSTSASETLPTLRRSRSRERSKSPLEERKSFSEFSSPQHECVASALKYFDRSESPIGRCRSLSPISIRLERIHRVNLKPLTSHSLNLSLERIHKINLSPLATFSIPSGEKLKKSDKENIEPSKQASTEEEPQGFESNNEERRNLGLNEKTVTEKQEYSYSYKEKIESFKQESTGEEPQRFELSKQVERENFGRNGKAVAAEQESFLTTGASLRPGEDEEMKMQKSYSYSGAIPKLGTLKRSNTIDFKTDIERVATDLEKTNEEQRAYSKKHLATMMRSSTNESDEVEEDRYTDSVGKGNLMHHDRPAKSGEDCEGIILPQYRSLNLAENLKESQSFDSGPSISDEERDSRDYVDKRVEEWVQRVDRRIGLSSDEDTSGSELMKEEETSPKTEEDEDDQEDLPHFYDSDGTTPVAEIRHLPGELFTQDSREEAERRQQWRSISQSTTPPNSPATSPPPPFQQEDIISQQPESSHQTEDPIIFSEHSATSSVVSIHHNVPITSSPNLLRSNIPLDAEISSHPEVPSEDLPSPMELPQTSVDSSCQDFGSNGKECLNEEISSHDKRRSDGDGVCDNDSAYEDDSLKEAISQVNVTDACESTNNNEYSQDSQSDVGLVSRKDSVDKVDSSRENGSVDDVSDVQDSNIEEESLQEYRNNVTMDSGGDSVEKEASSSKSRRAPVVTAGGNLIYYEEDTKEYEHDGDITVNEYSVLGEVSSREQRSGEDVVGRRESVSGDESSLGNGNDRVIADSHHISEKESQESGSKRSTPRSEGSIDEDNMPLGTADIQDSVSDRRFIDDSKALGLFPRRKRSNESEVDSGDSVCEKDQPVLSKEIRSNWGVAYSLESTCEENTEAISSTERSSDVEEKEYVGLTYPEVSHDGNFVTSLNIGHNEDCPTTLYGRSESADSSGDPMKYEVSISSTTSSKHKSDINEHDGEDKDCLSLASSHIQDGENIDDSDKIHDEAPLVPLSDRDRSDMAVTGYNECTNLEESLVTISNSFKRVMDVVTDSDSLHSNESHSSTSSKLRDTTDGNGEDIQEEESIAAVACKSGNDTDIVIEDECAQVEYLILDTDRSRNRTDLSHGLDSFHEKSLATTPQEVRGDVGEFAADESIRDEDSSMLYKTRNSIDIESNSEFIHGEESVGTESYTIQTDVDVTGDDFVQKEECRSIANTQEEVKSWKGDCERLSNKDDCLTAYESKKIEADVNLGDENMEGEDGYDSSDEHAKNSLVHTVIEEKERSGDISEEEESHSDDGSRKLIDSSPFKDIDEYPIVSATQQADNDCNFTFSVEEPTRVTPDENKDTSNTRLFKNVDNSHHNIMEDTLETKYHGTGKVDRVHAMMETDYSKLLLAAECHNVSVTDRTEDDFESLPSDEKASADRTSVLHDLTEVVEEESDKSTVKEESIDNLPGEDSKTIRKVDEIERSISEDFQAPKPQNLGKSSSEEQNCETDGNSESSKTINLEGDNGDKEEEEEEDDEDGDNDEDGNEGNEDSDDLTTSDDTSRSDANKENGDGNEDDESMTRSKEEETPTNEGGSNPDDTGDEEEMSDQASHGDDHCWTIKAKINANSDDSQSTLSDGKQVEEKTGEFSGIKSCSKAKDALIMTDEENSFESHSVRSKITGYKLSSENGNNSSGYHSADDSNPCKKSDIDNTRSATDSGDAAKESEFQEGTNLDYIVDKILKFDDIDKKIENVIVENRRCYFVTLSFLKRLNDRLRFSDQSAAAATTSKLSATATSALQPDADSANGVSRAHLTSTDAKSVSALHLAAEGRDYLMWCPDRDFDRAVSTLDVRGLVDLVQTLQDAMAVEQQTFDSLTQQLELVTDPLVQQRLSAALCTSQTRLARLCSRNMRCFTQQALKARQKDESRSSSPRDCGLVVSSSGCVSDGEGDARSPTTASFKNSLAFFQRAANIVASNPRSGPTEARKKDAHRRSSRGSSTCTSGSEDLSTGCGFIEDLPPGGDFVGGLSYLDGGGGGGGEGGGGGGGGYGEDEYDLGKFEDHGTYEQVLFINGRPQYQADDIHGDHRDERCGSGEPGDRNSSTRVRIDGSTGRSLVLQEASDVVDGGGGGGGGRGSDTGVGLTPAHSVANYSSLPRRAHARARKGASAAAEDEPRRGGLQQEQREQPQVCSDLGGYVTLPRRKPYLNLRSVSCGPSPGSAEFDNDDLSYFKEKVGISRSSSAHAITRTQSCKEGLNRSSSEFYNNSAYGLSRTQSFNDGLAGDFNGVESTKPKLQRAPSVDEILESVKSLRAKKNMVKSTPDLVGSQESSPYHSASLTRHKGKSHRASGSASSLLGVRYNGSSSGGDPHYDRVPEPDYEQIRESSSSASSSVTTNPYYENLVRDNYYENVHMKGEVIYDNPRPTEHHYDRVHDDIHYENLDYDDPVYENVHEKEPTYMNVSDSSTLSSTSSSSSLRSSKGKVYANLEATTGAQQKGSASSGTSGKGKGKSRGKVIVTGGSSVVEGLTYDVPRAATHIYDSPQKQIRSVIPTATQTQANEYDTPKSNRSVLPQSTQIVLQAKNEQKQRIDDIFADCDQDSLDGNDREPDIPSPDYGSEEETDTLEEKKGSTKDSFASSELADEGLGDSDSRSYYTEEQGLEVILEEPEEEYCSSATSEDDLQRDVDITHELKGERRSLDGSEGIGSAEGDCHSSGGSEHYAEEDCASSGIHSQDTPSPGPPVEDHSCDKDDLSPRGGGSSEEERIQKDRCVEVYPETVRQRQRNNNMSSNNKVDIKNWTSSSNKGDTNSPSKVKKFLPSVKALRNQFETGKTTPVGNGTVHTPTSTPAPTLSRKSSSSTSSLASSTLEKTSSTNSLASTENGSTENLLSSDIRDFVENGRTVIMDPDEPVEPIFNQFKSVDEELKELMSKPPSTTGWNPLPLLKRLYYVPEAPKMKSEGTTYINIEGYLEKLPSGRKKATFWNAWKRRYFIAKDGILYYYQNNQTEKPSMKLPLMGGKVECMEPNMVGVDDGAEKDDSSGSMIGVDDGKGHYVVVRCSSRQEAERWRRALETHTVEDFSSQYVQPWPIPTNPALLRDTLVVDLGSCSVRAGVLASNPTLPQVFFPCVVATQRDTRRQTWGLDALDPDVRTSASISFPVRPSHKITKYSVDLSAVSSLLQKTFADLKVDPKNYNLQLSVPRILNPNTQVELLKLLFDKFGCRSVNMTHQSILALYAYNATSGIVVDLGERMDIVPVIDGYIVDGGVSRVPYGGYRILDHLRQFLYMRNVSLVTEVEGYILRYVLEKLCYCAQHYNTEKARCTNNPDNFEKSVSLAEFFQGRECPYETISLDFGRFQSTEGIFNPDAWGLDHPGLHKLVHKAIQECSMDIRKEMSRSIFLVGGASQLPGLADRLSTELDNLTPPAIRPKVHCSPHRYHAAYLGACVLADSAAFQQSRITREEWNKYGNASIRKWSL